MEEVPMQSTGHLIVGDRTLLRDFAPEDVERFIDWQSHGEWRQYDAPWESGDQLSPEQEEKIRAFFLQLGQGDQPVPRGRAMICLREDLTPLGTVNRYRDSRFKDVFYIGISICEDRYLNHGLGSEAFSLWVDYQFENSTVHKIECHTWSLNPRMMHVAEKLGFQLEGRERELIQWQEQWQDRWRYGMLRSEWLGQRDPNRVQSKSI
jgi:RimJ/RimL family protein N-acetyltransferase